MKIKEEREIKTFGDLQIGDVCLKDNIHYIKIDEVFVKCNPIDSMCNVLRLNDYSLDVIEDDEKVEVFNDAELVLK